MKNAGNQHRAYVIRRADSDTPYLVNAFDSGITEPGADGRRRAVPTCLWSDKLHDAKQFTDAAEALETARSIGGCEVGKIVAS